MKDGNQIEKESNYWLKKSFSFVLLVLATIAMMSTAFRKIPEMEEGRTYLQVRLRKVEASLESWANAAANAIFERRKAQQEVKALSCKVEKLETENSVLKGKKAIVLEKKLSRKDSLKIYENLAAEVMTGSDSLEIYYEVEERLISKARGGVVPMIK